MCNYETIKNQGEKMVVGEMIKRYIAQLEELNEMLKEALACIIGARETDFDNEILAFAENMCNYGIVINKSTTASLKNTTNCNMAIEMYFTAEIISSNMLFRLSAMAELSKK